jgi:hypothetical protein
MYIAINYDTNCRGYHTNFPMVMPPIPTLSNIISQPLLVGKFMASLLLGGEAVYGVGKIRILGRSYADIDRDRDAGYRAIQGTRPYTLAFGLSDSPVGLLGKFSSNLIYTYVYSNKRMEHVFLLQLGYWKNIITGPVILAIRNRQYCQLPLMSKNF